MIKTADSILEGLTPEQRKIATSMDGKYMVLASSGSGKALVNGSKVQTPEGPINIEDLKIGDKVFDTQGKIQMVEGVYPQGKKQVYEVEFSDGTVVRCNDEHLWTYQTASLRARGKFETNTLRYIMDNIPLQIDGSGYMKNNLFVPMTDPVSYSEKEVPLNPYLLGALIGDGYLRQRGQSFSNPEEDVLSKVNYYLGKIGYELRHEDKNDYGIRMISLKSERHKKQYFSQALEELGLLGKNSHEKFIPRIYLESSVQQRLELLKGLIDTDASCEGSSYEYTTSSESLARDVVELVQSLGMTATVGVKESPTYTYKGERLIGKPSYRLRIKTSEKIEKIHSSEKHEEKWKKGQSSARRWVVAIRETEVEEEMTCISVSSEDRLFLTEGFVPTHNTRTLTARIEYLIHMGVKPYEIVGISFTKKASNEIKERMAARIGEIALDVNMGTFHSLCMRILLTNQHLLGYENMTVIDDEESRGIIKEIGETHGYMSKEGIADVQRSVDYWGNRGLFPEQVRELNQYADDMINIYAEYFTFKKNVGYVDFNDILMLTSLLFKQHPNVQEKYARKFRYILVDESQDLNAVQTTLLYQMSSVHNNYMLFGDDFQAIYKFRGGDVQNIFDIRRKDAEVDTILLERNFRSTQTIVEASNALIAQNKDQMEKVSYSKNSKGAPIFVYDAADETREADFVVEVIEGLVKNGKYTYEDFYILYRSHFLSRALEFGLNRAGVPYEVVGGAEFYERIEIKVLVCYLRALDNPLDDIAFERIINFPKRGIGATTIDRLKMYASENELSFFKAMQHVEDIPKINRPTKARILEFCKMLEHGQEMILKEDASVQEALGYILSQTNFLDEYDKNKTKDIERIQNINELWNVSTIFDEKEKEDLVEGQSILNQFLTETALYIPDEDMDRMERVTLMTSHSAKGLENKVVFIVGLQEGTFPSHQTRTDEEHEEERRLFYVAMTRAEELLFLTYNQKSYFRGQELVNSPSRYLSEIPEKYVHHLGEANN